MRGYCLKQLLLLFLLFTGIIFSYAQPGANDSTFNTYDDGTFGDGSGFNTTVFSTAVQSDGKIIAAGGFTSFNGTARNFIARLNTDGSLDNGFNLWGFNNGVWSTAIQSDGKIIAVGDFTSFNGTTINRIARLNTDGSLDVSFNPGAGFNGWVSSTAIQSDDKIIAAGDFTSFNGTAINRIARLNADGLLDTTFNSGTGFSGIVYSIAIQSDGKIIAAGDFTSFNGTAINRIIRLNADGSLDTTFNPGTGFSGIVYSNVIQSDGKIIAAGDFFSFNGTTRNRIARLNADGSIDTGFNPGTGFNNAVRSIVLELTGKIIAGGWFTSFNGTARNYIARLNADGSYDTTFNPGTGFNDRVYTTAIQIDGKIIAGGWLTSLNGTARNRIARLNADGSPDKDFNPWPGFNDRVYTTAIQIDGKIIAAGYFTSLNGTARNRIARLNADGSLDTTFNPGTGFPDRVQSIAIQSDGKIIAAGFFNSFNGTARNFIARLNADGSLDTGFNPGTGFNALAQTIAIQSDGKIIAAGRFTSFNGTAINRIARLNTDGSLDTTFNPGTGFNDWVESTAIQSDGKIVAGGRFTSFNGTAINRIARLNAGGSLDTGFNPGTGFNGFVYSIVMKSDGKIIAAGGFTSLNGTARNYIARLNADGSYDTGFTTGTGFNSTVRSIVLQSDGKIIAGGWFTSFNGTTRNRIARLNADGLIDAGFNPGMGFNDFVESIAMQSDGKIIAAGQFTSFNGTARTRIARLLNCPILSGTDTQTACDSYTWIDGNTYTASNNTATFTLTNASGCDSVVTLNLTIKNSTSGTGVQTACDSYTLNSQTYTTSGTYTQVLTNTSGCDSTITLNLTVENSTASSLAETACDSYTLNSQTYTSGGTYTQTLTNAAGCDSTITLNLTLNNSTVSSLNENACDSYTLNGQTYNTNGTYTQMLVNTAGCDSTITLNLMINTADTSVTQNQNVLTASATGAAYQWIDCDNGNNPIVDETSQSFTAIANGSYAVIVTENGCTDTSACYAITGIGIMENSFGSGLMVFPNPTSGRLSIDLAGNYKGITVQVRNIAGQLVFKESFGSSQLVELNLESLSNGVYMIKIAAADKNAVVRVIKGE